jgi:hypothetical protein
MFLNVITGNRNQVPGYPVAIINDFSVLRFSQLAVISGYRLFRVNNHPTCTPIQLLMFFQIVNCVNIFLQIIKICQCLS